MTIIILLSWIAFGLIAYKLFKLPDAGFFMICLVGGPAAFGAWIGCKVADKIYGNDKDI